MKTLYININNEQIQSNEELKVLEHDLDGDFFFYFGGKIAKGCNIDNEYAVITDFNKEDYKEEYKQITTQWNEIKTILFSEECKGRFELTLPNGYIHWLKFHPQYVSVYQRNFSHGEPAVITIDLEELYEDSVENLQKKILRKLQRDDLYLEIDEIVFNDNTVTRKSPIVCKIREKYEGIGFKSYKKWLQKNGEIPQKPKAPSPVCDKCGKDSCECTLSSYDFFPLENVVLHKTSCSSILQEHLEYGNNLIYYEPKPGLVFIQQKRDTFFSIVSISEEEAYPKLWRSLLELKWGESYNACISIVKKKGYKYRVEDLDGGGAWTNKLLVLSIDEKYIFEFSFLHCKLNLIRAFLNRCPHCKSNNLMLLEHFNSDEIKMKCMDCGLLLIDGLGIECPECRSENIKDDGSSYLQYTCNICGHNWGHDDTVKCPECGSGDITNDGTDYMQYECNACGFMWGDDEEYDSDRDNTGHSISDFFDSFGFPFDKTTRYDIKSANGVLYSKDEQFEIYKMPNGILVYFFKRHEDYIHNIHVSDNNGIPLFYKNLGMYWGINKTDFRNIFENLGFYIEEDEELDSITAYIKCIKWNRFIGLEIMYCDLEMIYLDVTIYDYKPY